MMKLSINSSARLTFQLKVKLLTALENNSGGTSTKIGEATMSLQGQAAQLRQCDAWSRLHTQIHTRDAWVVGRQRHSGKEAARPTDIHMKQNEV